MLEIRKSYPTDAYALINISDITWKNAFYDILPNGILHDNIHNIEKRVRHLQDQINENNRIFVALEDGVPIGYIFYAKAQNVVYDAAAEIRSIYILPEFQKQGIGTKLFENVLEEIKHLGYTEATIGVDKNNYIALHLYQSKGFTNILYDGKDENGEFYKLMKQL